MQNQSHAKSTVRSNPGEGGIPVTPDLGSGVAHATLRCRVAHSTFCWLSGGKKVRKDHRSTHRAVKNSMIVFITAGPSSVANRYCAWADPPTPTRFFGSGARL